MSSAATRYQGVPRILTKDPQYFIPGGGIRRGKRGQASAESRIPSMVDRARNSVGSRYRCGRGSVDPFGNLGDGLRVVARHANSHANRIVRRNTNGDLTATTAKIEPRSLTRKLVRGSRDIRCRVTSSRTARSAPTRSTRWRNDRSRDRRSSIAPATAASR